jgi:hypothetical protein
MVETTHSALVFPVAQPDSTRASAGGAKVAGNPSILGAPIGLRVYFESVDPGEAYAKTGVMLKAPAYIQCEVSEAGYFQPDAEVVVQGRTYVVRGLPEIHDAGDQSDHADVVLELKQYPITK